MYIPNNFKIENTDDISAFIEQNSFGQLISNVGGRLYSSHIPILLNPTKTKILCHLAKQNPQHTEIGDQEVLITLQGPHNYISPSWYSSSPGVPTWNYQAVHIYGECRIFHEPSKLKHLVDSLTEKYESDSMHPWQPEYPTSILQAIVGIEITIREIQCKYKLSQNRSQHDQLNIIEKLKASGSNKLAEAMEQNVI